MSRNGSGVYSRISPPGTGGYVSGDIIDPSIVNNEIDDIGDEITNSIDKGGRTTPTANLPMGGFRHTGVGNGSARNDYASVAQLQDGGVLVGSAVAEFGSATCTLTPAITSYVNGQKFRLKWFVDAGGASNLNINGVGIKNIVKYQNGSTTSLRSDDIKNSTWVDITYDSTLDAFVIANLNHNYVTPKAVAYVASTGSIIRSHNVSTVSKASTGTYNITLSNTVGLSTDLMAFVTTDDQAVGAWFPNGAGVVTVKTRTNAGTPIDSDFAVMVF